jgi:hypothetical protein
MATLLDRILHDTDPASDVSTDQPISTHDWFAYLRLYKHAPTDLGATPLAIRNAARDAFDLTDAQRDHVVEWTDSVDGGANLHLYEASIMGYQKPSANAAGRMLNKSKVKSILSLTSD